MQISETRVTRAEAPNLLEYRWGDRTYDHRRGKARLASSMKGNPIALTDAELAEIANRALGGPG